MSVVTESDAPPIAPPPGRIIGGPGRFVRWFSDTGWRHVVALLTLAFALFPVLWVISGSFTDGNLSSQTLIPKNPTLDNYRKLLTDPGHPPYWSWFKNSMIVGVATSLLTVALAAAAAFAFSRLRFKGRRPGLLALLLIQMFPAMLAMTALYLLMLTLKNIYPAIGLGTIWGLILIYLGGALGVNTWLMKGFFDTIPIELDESAKVDGATHAEIYFKIVLPLAAPVLAVIGLLSFINTQAEYLLASIMLRGSEQKMTLAVGLNQYISQGFDSQWGPFAAGALIGAIPVVVLFLFLQRFIVSGLTAGAVKG